MNRKGGTMMTAVGLGAVLASSILPSGCVVRAQGHLTTEPVHVVDEAPPAPREEPVTSRPGYVWIRGRWEFVGGQWAWRPGSWQRERSGQAWEAGHWQRRGNRYYWVDGRWVAAGRVRVRRHEPPPTDVRDHRGEEPARDHGGEGPARDHGGEGPARDHGGEGPARDHRGERPTHTVTVHPTEPPPAPRTERAGRRAGYVWVSGRYRWEGGGYQWVSGHWERERRGMVWVAGHWERRGNHYVWIEGSWQRQ